MAIMDKANKLNEEELNKVGGGYIHQSGSFWELITNDGHRIWTSGSYETILEKAAEGGYNTVEIDDDFLNALRNGAVAYAVPVDKK